MPVIFKDTKPVTVAANSSLLMARRGNYIRVESLSGVSTIHLKDESGNLDVEVELGDEVFLDETIDKFFIVNENGTGAVINLKVGLGRLRKSQVLGAVSLSVPSGFDSKADVSISATSTSVVLASNAARRRAIITAPSSNIGSVRIGDSAVGAANGLYLPPGGRLEIEGNTELSCYNPNGSVCEVNVAEVTT